MVTLKKKPVPAGDDGALLEKIRAANAANSTYEEHNAFPFSVVRKYGARGYALLMSQYSSEGRRYFDLEDLPAGSPFRALRGAMSAREVVTKVFAPLSKGAPAFVAAMRKRCRAVIALERTGGEPGENGWFLLYFLDRGSTIPSGKGRYTRIAGRAPERKPRLNRVARAKGFEVPASLRAFYAVHDGLGLSGVHTAGVESIMSADALRPIPAAPDLLEFFCDSGGNRKAFARGEDDVIDWDRSTHDRAKEGSFWKFLEGEVVRHLVGAD